MKIVKEVRCCKLVGCPAVLFTDNGKCFVIGRQIAKNLAVLGDRVGINEIAIEVPLELMETLSLKT